MILIQMDCFKNQCFCDNNFDDCGSPTGYVRYIFLNQMFKWNILDEKPFYFLVKLTQPLLVEPHILNSQVMNAKNVCFCFSKIVKIKLEKLCIKNLK